MRERESRSSTRRDIRLACSAMIERNRSRAALSSRAGPRSVSIKPNSVASGVRSSWLAFATKSCRMRSLRLVAVMSVKVTTAAAPSEVGGRSRPIWALRWRSTAPGRSTSTVRPSPPSSTASVASSTAGTRSAAPRSRPASLGPRRSTADGFALTMRRSVLISNSGSGSAESTDSALARASALSVMVSRSARAKRPTSRPSSRAVGLRVTMSGSAVAPCASASSACFTCTSPENSGPDTSAMPTKIAAVASAAAPMASSSDQTSALSTAAVGSVKTRDPRMMRAKGGARRVMGGRQRSCDRFVGGEGR